MTTRVQGGTDSDTAGTTLSVALGATPLPGNVICIGATWFNSGAGAAGAHCAAKDGNNNVFRTARTQHAGASGQSHIGYLIVEGNPHATITLEFSSTIEIADCWVEEFSPTPGFRFVFGGFDINAAAGNTAGTITLPAAMGRGEDNFAYFHQVSGNAVSSVNSPWTASPLGVLNGNTTGYDLSYTGAQPMDITLAGSAIYFAQTMTFRLERADPPGRLAFPGGAHQDNEDTGRFGELDIRNWFRRRSGVLVPA